MAKGNSSNGSAAVVDFEATLWAAADKLRNEMDAAHTGFTIFRSAQRTMVTERLRYEPQ